MVRIYRNRELKDKRWHGLDKKSEKMRRIAIMSDIHLSDHRGPLMNPKIVDAFIDEINHYKSIGELILLSDILHTVSTRI